MLKIKIQCEHDIRLWRRVRKESVEVSPETVALSPGGLCEGFPSFHKLESFISETFFKPIPDEGEAEKIEALKEKIDDRALCESLSESYEDSFPSLVNVDRPDEPHASGKPFKLLYVDADEDEITVETADEWRDLIACAFEEKQKSLKLFVKKLGGEKNADSPPPAISITSRSVETDDEDVSLEDSLSPTADATAMRHQKSEESAASASRSRSDCDLRAILESMSCVIDGCPKDPTSVRDTCVISTSDLEALAIDARLPTPPLFDDHIDIAFLRGAGARTPPSARTTKDEIMARTLDGLEDDATVAAIIAAMTGEDEAPRAPMDDVCLSIHNGVRCDGCGTTPIIGARYKCGLCQNTDFCSACERQLSLPASMLSHPRWHPLIKFSVEATDAIDRAFNNELSRLMSVSTCSHEVILQQMRDTGIGLLHGVRELDAQWTARMAAAVHEALLANATHALSRMSSVGGAVPQSQFGVGPVPFTDETCAMAAGVGEAVGRFLGAYSQERGGMGHGHRQRGDCRRFMRHAMKGFLGEGGPGVGHPRERDRAGSCSRGGPRHKRFSSDAGHVLGGGAEAGVCVPPMDLGVEHSEHAIGVPPELPREAAAKAAVQRLEKMASSDLEEKTPEVVVVPLVDPMLDSVPAAAEVPGHLSHEMVTPHWFPHRHPHLHPHHPPLAHDLGFHHPHHGVAPPPRHCRGRPFGGPPRHCLPGMHPGHPDGHHPLHPAHAVHGHHRPQSQREEPCCPKPAACLTTKKKMCAKFLDNLTIPDRSAQLCGATLTKTWILRNDGSSTWRDGQTEVAFLRGDKSLITCGESFTVPVTEPRSSTEVSVTVKVPENEGRFVAYFRLRQCETKEWFGPRLWVDIFAKNSLDTDVDGEISRC